MSEPARFAARVRRRFFGDGANVAAVFFLTTLAVFGALAPLLCHDRPLFLDDDSTASSPLFTSLGKVETTWIVVAAAFFVGAALRHRRARCLVALVALMTIVVVCTDRAPRHETRHYLEEERLRRALESIDRDSRLGIDDAGALEALRMQAHSSLAVALEIEERLAVRGDRVALAAAEDRNASRLRALEGAVWPLHRQSPELTSFAGLLRPGQSEAHPLGTDALGRDLLAVLVHGCRRAITTAVVATALAAGLGLLLGALGGWFGGAVDWIVQRLLELTLCLPALFLIVVLASRLPPELRTGSLSSAMVIGLLLWPATGRLVRAAVIASRGADHVLAARALGMSSARLLFRHVLPNAATPLLVAAAFTAAGIVGLDATLSFLGIGAELAPGWGRTLHDARAEADLGLAWHLAVFPGLLTFLTTLAFARLGDGLRTAAED